MAIYALGELSPDIHPEAYVHPDATLIGNVTLGPGATVWPQAVLRGDYGSISVGARTSIQDGTVVHCTPADATVIGTECVVGHNVHIEGAEVGRGCLIASGSVVLNGAVVEDGAAVGAGAVVTYGGHVPARRMVLGVPAKLRADYEVSPELTEAAMRGYVANGEYYRTALKRLD